MSITQPFTLSQSVMRQLVLSEFEFRQYPATQARGRAGRDFARSADHRCRFARGRNARVFGPLDS
jgi:hypothetical protein